MQETRRPWLVLPGLGATVVSTLATWPWLVTIARRKLLTFAVSGVVIAAGYINIYYIAPPLRSPACSPDSPDACETASRCSRFVLWTSVVFYSAGFFAAFLLGPPMTP